MLGDLLLVSRFSKHSSFVFKLTNHLKKLVKSKKKPCCYTAWSNFSKEVIFGLSRTKLIILLDFVGLWIDNYTLTIRFHPIDKKPYYVKKLKVKWFPVSVHGTYTQLYEKVILENFTAMGILKFNILLQVTWQHKIKWKSF